jgi:uncharacterized DUF497 family protein
MAIIFDPAKSAKNVTERGLSFELVAELDWDRAIIDEDMRKDFGDLRLLILAPPNGRLHALVATPRGRDLRVISFRKANKKEIRKYGKSD